jgi:leucyl-tRNA synthetase
MGPYDLGGDWNDHGIVGIDRFVQRTYDLFTRFEGINNNNAAPDKFDLTVLKEDEKIVYRKVNQTLNKFEEELENFRFNTAVASLMELVNELFKSIDKCNSSLQLYTLERFAVMIAPIAPHLGEECWKLIGNDKSIFEQINWFKPDEAALTEDKVTIAVQINGKLRATLEVPIDSDQTFVKGIAFNDGAIKRHIEGKTVVKEIFVKNKIYNIVVK